MAEMSMIEDAAGNITWECSKCGALLKDYYRFEDNTKTCPKCNAPIDKFNSLYDEEDD